MKLAVWVYLTNTAFLLAQLNFIIAVIIQSANKHK